MGKIVRLTESELINLVKKVLSEQQQSGVNTNGFLYKITGENHRSYFTEAYLGQTGSGFEVSIVKIENNIGRKGSGVQPELIPNFIVPKISDITAVVNDTQGPPTPTGIAERSSGVIKTLIATTSRTSKTGAEPILYEDADGIPKVGYLTYTSYASSVPVRICKNRLKEIPKVGTSLKYGDCWISKNKKLIYTMNLRPEKGLLPQPEPIQ
jgi:hypothetical protein